ncbi:hypothetical protein ACFX13_015844 [Malus domestica]|uniref:Uncharacterized protein n=1 Tax=Malus domestica TaxID=3750 RepID=A0A498I5S0_MALDO|nr:hypothetical protein DVH24_023816 [Malus domestica]
MTLVLRELNPESNCTVKFTSVLSATSSDQVRWFFDHRQGNELEAWISLLFSQLKMLLDSTNVHYKTDASEIINSETQIE